MLSAFSEFPSLINSHLFVSRSIYSSIGELRCKVLGRNGRSKAHRTCLSCPGYYSLPCIRFDPSPLQDFCVADFNSAVSVNGYACKDPDLVTPEDFSFTGLAKVASTGNHPGSNITLVDVQRIPGLNTLGVAMSRIDFAPHGINPPHSHPRSSEIFHVAQGALYVGFVTANGPGGNRLFAKKLEAGGTFVFPQGLVHYQFNFGNASAVAFASFGSQSPGLITQANALFGVRPAIPSEVLANAFQLDEKTVLWLQQRQWVDNHN